MAEQWRDVPGFEGSYEVSSLGRVRSLARVVVRSGSRSYPVSERILRQGTTEKGYRFVGLYLDGRAKSPKVHRLVALAFLGDPQPGQEVRHLDGDKGNNSAQNLKWGTSRENKLDMVAHGGNRHSNKTHCIRNHEFTEENTRIRKNGWRACRQCDRETKRKDESDVPPARPNPLPRPDRPPGHRRDRRLLLVGQWRGVPISDSLARHTEECNSVRTLHRTRI